MRDLNASQAVPVLMRTRILALLTNAVLLTLPPVAVSLTLLINAVTVTLPVATVTAIKAILKRVKRGLKTRSRTLFLSHGQVMTEIQVIQAIAVSRVIVTLHALTRTQDSPAERQESRFRSRPMVRTGARSRESANESSAERPRKRARTELEQERDEYKPFSLSEKDDGTWKLPQNCVDYASPFFCDYHTESELKPLLESNPRPGHSFLKIEKVDSSVKQGLKAKCGKLGEVTLERDKRLRSIHEKIVRASGRMGRIWETLDGARKANSEKKVDLAKLLENIEQSFLLLGQAVVACRWHRRLEITTAITKSKRDSKELLHMYDQYLDDEEFLFGKRHLKKVEKEEAKKPTDKGLFVVLNPVKKHNARHSKFQNPSFRHFQSQDTNQPFRQGPRMEGGDRRGQKTKRGGIRGRARGSSRPGRYVILSFNKETGKRKTTPGSRSKEFKGVNVMSGNISKPLQATDGFGSKTPTKKPNSNRGKGKISNKKLGKNHKRSSNPPISSRLPNSILSASTDRQTNKPKVFSKGERVNIHRSERDVEERCNRTGGTQNRPICGPHIPQGEERWGTEASVQPEETECFRGIQALQDGRPAHGENGTAGKRLADKARSKGRLLLCSDEGEPRDISGSHGRENYSNFNAGLDVNCYGCPNHCAGCPKFQQYCAQFSNVFFELAQGCLSELLTVIFACCY